jgi:energy-converting hydrogenase Eha subunit C
LETLALGMVGAVLGSNWSDVAVWAALVAAIVAFVGALVLTVGRGGRSVERDDEVDLPLAG